MKKHLLGFLVAICVATFSMAQTAPFQIHIESVSISELGGLQAYAVGQSDGKWLLVGGRLDGLHKEQPFAAFDEAGNNKQLIVIDPIKRQKWSAAITSLSVALQESLSSTNMEFHQDGDVLYLIGGYGHNKATNSKKTFNYLTAIDVSKVIEAVMEGKSLTPYFRQISDAKFAVTGGHLEQINNTYYLVGGNKFDGRYNPMGNPTYTQAYTNSIHKFTIDDDGSKLTVNHITTVTDEASFHRRDYNAIAQILPNGAEGITVFSGVFQPLVNLPYLNCVNIDSSSHQIVPDFKQYYNHYHCPVLPIYSPSKNEMHNLFFGGIAQFYDSAGVLKQDDNVPFVNTIARITRDEAGIMTEYKLPVVMPSLLGAGAEFILNKEITHFRNGVLNLDEFGKDSTLVGYIFGGISSDAPNIFMTNGAGQSVASSNLFKVYVVKSDLSSVDQINPRSNNALNATVFPNPSNGNFEVQFNAAESENLKTSLFDINGNLVFTQEFENLPFGENRIQLSLKDKGFTGNFILMLETTHQKTTQKISIW